MTKVCRVLLINIAAFYKNVAISQISATETVLFCGLQQRFVKKVAKGTRFNSASQKCQNILLIAADCLNPDFL